MGTTSSCATKRLTHEYLPFALQLHAMLPEHLNLALYHLVIRMKQLVQSEAHYSAQESSDA